VNNYSGTGADAYEAKISALSGAGYHKLSYNLPTEGVFPRTLGVTDAATQGNPKDALIGLPDANFGTGDGITGLSDYYSCNSTTNQTSQYLFGVLRGGTTLSGTYAGAFCINVTGKLTLCNYIIGLRSSLVG